ncbi:molybdenum cofactor guanylyltransferase MobA [Jannaschia sp. LMIT008]|uniref:molybdenum cofactor guanylyltransferase MobA n=1 Tax=Jannaschia maritima TaxID=3032585 RepID=UPI0028109E5C|nr:molybdenum cofactor guanylyltransferase MobA [Jannaschia sp. LMIT008]
MIPAVILAGGLARRMGGGDKGRALLQGRPLIRHVLDRLQPQCAPIALNANGDPARWDDLGLPVLPDTRAGHPGPLAGVLAGMRWAAALGRDRIVTAAADTPFLPPTLVADLAAAGDGLVLARAGGRPQPTFGLWPTALADDLDEALGAGTRKILDWTDRHAPAHADFPAEAFFNVNRPEDLDRAP